MSTIVLGPVLEAMYHGSTAANPSSDADAGAAFLRKLCEIYGLSQSSYMTVDKRSRTAGLPKIIVAYPDEWKTDCLRRFKDKNDPVLSPGTAAIQPFEWSYSIETGICNNTETDDPCADVPDLRGLTIPIHSRSTPSAIFSIAGRFDGKGWQEFKHLFLRDFVAVANFLHGKYYIITNILGPRLSGRESEILQFCAMGNTSGEIAKFLNISNSTVKYHLNEIRFKLDVLNTVQAVSRAIKFGLIEPL